MACLSAPVPVNGDGRGPNARYNYNRMSKNYDSKTRIYISVQGETVLDQLEGRRNRPVKLLREILLTARPDLKGRIRWSQYAGCSCPCSPGFIVDTTLRNEQGQPLDMWLEIGEKPAPKAPEVDMSYVELALS